MSAPNQILTIPDQMVSDSKKKTKKWQKDNVNAFESMILFENRQIKTSYLNKVINYNLKRNVLNMKDIISFCNTWDVNADLFPGKLEHKGLGNAKIDRLVGQHSQRKFDWRVIRANSDQSGLKIIEEKKTKEYVNFFLEKLQQSEPKEVVQEELQKLQEYVNSPFYDLAETGCNKILKYTYKRYNYKELFDRVFEDALISAEQYAFIENNGEEFTIRKGDPTKIFTLMDAYSTTEEGLEALVEINYHTVSSILDMFYMKLKPEDLAQLEKYRTSGGGNMLPEYSKNGHIGELLIPADSLTAQIGEQNPAYDYDTTLFSSAFDSRGNIRLLRVYWKSKRKIKIVKSTNEIGVEELRPEHESYVIDELKGEELDKEIWINEWWRGYKIGIDIFPEAEPIPFLSTSMENICRQEPPVVIQYYNTNSSRAQSLMDIVKPYDYLYNIYDYKRQILVNQMLPDILTYNTAMIPDNLSMAEYMSMIVSTAFMPQDPTSEIVTPRGNMAAGQMNTVVPTMISSTQRGPLTVLNEIMNDVKNTMSIVSGISEQSQGITNQYDAAGNVQSSIVNSAINTERWFSTNDFFKQRVLQKSLDLQLSLLRKNPKKLTMLTDDFTAQILSDPEMEAITTGDFDIMVSKSSDDEAIMQKIETHLQMGIKNGTIDSSDIVSFYKSDSLSEGARLLKRSEQKRQQQQQQLQEQQAKLQQQQLQATSELEKQKIELEYKKLELDRYKIDMDYQKAINVAELTSLGFADSGASEITSAADQAIKEQKNQHDLFTKQSETARKERETNAKLMVERERLQTEKEKIAADERMEKQKNDTALKVAKSNKNKYDKK